MSAEKGFRKLNAFLIKKYLLLCVSFSTKRYLKKCFSAIFMQEEMQTSSFQTKLWTLPKVFKMLLACKSYV